jgi:phosphatidylethanolamine/phosphatidyl-N-methylethanolamine N-methyltransferase
MTDNSRGLFLREWARAPLRTAAIAPSSRGLGKLITSEISPNHGPIIELGPGTGVFTHALIARGVPEHEIAMIEVGSEFAVALNWKFPAARVLWADAAQLAALQLFEAGTKAGAAVSGLPISIMPRDKVRAILVGTFQHMRDDASLYQFTYGHKIPVPDGLLRQLGLKATRIGGVLMNAPPASVYRINRA